MDFKKILFIIILSVAVYALAYADTLHFKNGRILEGIIKSENSTAIELEVAGGTVVFQKQEVDRVSRAKEADNAALRKLWQERKNELNRKIAVERKAEEKPKKTDITKEEQGIMVTATLNGKSDVRLLLDTGSSLVIIRKRIAQELGIIAGRSWPQMYVRLADGRQVPARRVVLKSVKVQGVEARNVEAAIIMVEAGDPSFGDGLLGMSFLNRFNFKIDNIQNKLILEKLP